MVLARLVQSLPFNIRNDRSRLFRELSEKTRDTSLSSSIARSDSGELRCRQRERVLQKSSYARGKRQSAVLVAKRKASY